MFRLVLSNIAKSKLLHLLVCRLYLSGFNVLFSYLTQLGLGTIEEGAQGTLFQVAAYMIGGALLYIFFYYVYSLNLAKVFQETSQFIVQKLIQSFINKRDSQEQTTEGEAVNLIHTDATNISLFLSSGLLPLLDTSLSLLVGVVYVMSMNQVIGSVFIFGGLLIGLGNYLLTSKMELAYEDYMVAADQNYNFYEQVFRIMPIVKIFKISDWLYRKQVKFFSSREKHFNQYNGYYANSLSLTEGGVITFEIISLALGLYLVIAGQLEMAVLLGIWNAGLGSIIYPLSDLPSLWNYFVQYRSSAKRVSTKWLDDQASGQAQTREELPEKAGKGITLENVSFSYQDKQVFNQVNFRFEPKGIHFLVGPSGSGKSTLLNLILGVYVPHEGRIVFDQANEELGQETIGYVPQKVTFFNTSLRSNLLMGRTVSDQQIKEVCSALNIWEVIQQLPKGLDTVYGEDIKLSNGQIRRLAVARALLSGAHWIILDEPFSDLDRENQGYLMTCLRELRDHSFIIVTHTSDMIQANDRVIEVQSL